VCGKNKIKEKYIIKGKKKKETKKKKKNRRERD
jgi:hypothetical protein